MKTELFIMKQKEEVKPLLRKVADLQKSETLEELLYEVFRFKEEYENSNSNTKIKNTSTVLNELTAKLKKMQ